MINLAQAAFAQASGQPGLARRELSETVSSFARENNMSPRQEGELHRAVQNDFNDLLNLARAANEGRQKANRGDSKGKGNNWLQIIADVMGKAMDSKVQEMKGLAEQIDSVKHKQSEKSNSTQLNTDLQVKTQEFSMMLQSTSNIIKTVGEGLSQMARKG